MTELSTHHFGYYTMSTNKPNHTISHDNPCLECVCVCGTLKCENAAICENVATCKKNSTLNVKIDAICEKITLNVKK